MRQHKPRLRILPPVELRSNAKAALLGARYDVEKAQELMQNRGVQTLWQQDRDIDEPTRVRLQHELNQFHWHLRA